VDVFFRFLLLGVGAGAGYSLLGLGVVLVYRGSGVVNFAQGAVGLCGVAVFYELRNHTGSPAAVVAGVLAAGALGAVIQAGVMRPLRSASPLMRIVATLAILAAITEGATLRYGVTPLTVAALFSQNAVKFSSGIIVGEDRLINLGITVVLTAVLWVIYRKTRFGLKTSAAAENQRAAASLGHSPNLLSIGNWAAGGALAGMAGILLAPITSLSPHALTLTVVPALAAALFGNFASFPLTLVGGLGIGILESESTNYIKTPGWSTAVPFLVIVLVLLLRGRAIPLRSEIADRLPGIGSGRLAIIGAPAGLIVTVLLDGWFTESWSAAVMTGTVYAFIALSLVVVTGYAGQLSLAQFALAGVGALVASRMADAWNVPFPLALLAGVAVTILAGAIVALPAVRIRGVSLAVVTMSLAVVLTSVLLTNPSYTGGALQGTIVAPPKLAGYSIDPVTHALRYANFGVTLLFLVSLMIANLRRGRAGRRMIAVRDNERAAASLGIGVASVKLYAFSLAGGLAAIGGILLAFQNQNVVFDPYDVFNSINAILYSVIGGIGFIGGTVIAGAASPGGPTQELLGHFFQVGDWYLFVSALVVLVALIVLPDGVAATQAERIASIRARITRRERRGPQWDLSTSTARRVEPRTVVVQELGVRFGTVNALRDVSLTVKPGQVLGLIGPNGAGKTTLIDAVTGFIRNYKGTVTVDGEPLRSMSSAKRARAGLTRSFQSLELFEDLTVADNLRTASDRRDAIAYATDLVHPGKPALSPQAVTAVQEFELEPYLNKLPRELPYAQRRLVGIARAIAVAPSILLLDEPAAGLDQQSTAELGRLIRRLAEDWGMAILLIEHDVQMVLEVCDQIVVLNFGEVLASGTPKEIRRNRAVVDAYLGSTGDETETAQDKSDAGTAASRTSTETGAA
jgi:ABC-type branched-subunit amino acid transport system ATPase component/branched-subunit amino acid ABC-type transport system permease component